MMAQNAADRGELELGVRGDRSGPVTTARSDVDIIVTEFGAAELRGPSLAERTRRLIAIADPNFRDELARAAHEIQTRGF